MNEFQTTQPPALPKRKEERPPLTILLAVPRGFCAGVDRAVPIVELALEKYGAPVYVRHEIVHNRYVVDSLRNKGAIFVEELDEIPDTDAPVIFSAHGVPKSVPENATKRKMFFLDATCPLVSKVHMEAERHHEQGLEIILIGHAGHPEVIGTMGQLPGGVVKLVESAGQARAFEADDPKKLAYITQTTLSIDDTQEIVDILRERFPAIIGPHKEDICYATTNRQMAVKSLASRVDLWLVIGDRSSSNSNRLREIGESTGVPAYLVLDEKRIKPEWLVGVETVGITSGASTPEVSVRSVVDRLRELGATTVEEVEGVKESIEFQLPVEVR